MARVIATINLKGGVGKTTTTVSLAETLVASFGRRVLVIDLDPQTNASLMLLGEERWQALSREDRTLARLFRTAREGAVDFAFEHAVAYGASDVREAADLDLLASSIDLVDLQDLMGLGATSIFDLPIDLLHDAVAEALADYDLVLIDCPPNLGVFTLNGLRMADAYLIPTIPDPLSTYGIPQIVSRVSEFSQGIGRPIRPLGILATKVQANNRTHAITLAQLRQGRDGPLFDTLVPQAAQISRAAEHSPSPRTLKQKYGYDGLVEVFEALASEVLATLELLS